MSGRGEGAGGAASDRVHSAARASARPGVPPAQGWIAEIAFQYKQ